MSYELSSAHRPHDPRKTFISLAKYYGVDEYAIKKVVGHKISDLTDAVYTTKPDDWLFKEMKKKKNKRDCRSYDLTIPSIQIRYTFSIQIVDK